MALAHNPPNTIWLGGEITKQNEWPMGVVGTPGMLVDTYDDAGKMKWRPHASATELAPTNFLVEKTLHNKTVSDTYAVDELAMVFTFHKGSAVWALVPSGQNIVAGDKLQSNGDGMLKKSTATTAAANVSIAEALESTGGAITVTTRLRVQII